ncbi:unnamed protein product [Rotaria sordida]|uniref:RING-type domain-containing protein n=1 Tax=Rotaria sordida TaxID=392033 RepID=A0A818RG72_9BILA|nr:unnamed protein product [Rotaria sordida]
MSRVASNLPTTRQRNGVGQSTKPLTSRSSSNTSLNSSGGDGRGFNIRSAAPPPVQKETVHACPLCNSEYKDPRVLPCTHTYCFNCIRDKLIKNSRITCPKCHYQAHPFDDTHLHELPPNLILSQKWRIGARPMPSMPTSKNPITYQSNIPSIQISQQDKRKSIINENNEYERPTNGVASIVNTFNQTLTIGGNTNQSSRSSSNTQPVVSNLIKIYSEARTLKPQQNENLLPTNKHDELTKIFQQIINENQQQQQQQQTTSQLNDREPSQAYEEVYEEITWENLPHGTTPAAPPFPEQLQTATVNQHYPPDLPERPLSATSSDHNSAIDNLRDIFIAIHHQQSSEKISSFQQIPIVDVPTNSRLSTPSHLHNEDDEDININQTSLHQNLNTMTLQPQHTRQASNTDSVHSVTSDSTSRRSIISPIINPNNNNNNQQQRFNEAFTYQQDDKISHRTVSMSSLSRNSLDPFPPPPQNLEIPDTINNDIGKQRSTSAMSYRSSINDDRNEHMMTSQPKLIRNEPVNPDVGLSPTIQRNNSSRINSASPIPINRLPTMSMERDTNYSRQQENYLSPSPLLPTVVTSRVDILLSDQKRLEREIEEQIQRLKYDYDDVRKQIGRKESSIHNEVKNIAERLDNDITEHYNRKQKIYADLATDTNVVGTELERLKSTTNNNNNNNNTNNNKQQLWANLEQIETNIRNIRQAVEQQKEPNSVLTFAEGRRAIAADTIGQITYNGTETQQRYTTSPTRSIPSSLSNHSEQPITNLTPFKYFKIDHLSTLEPEAIAVTENNKKILLGICNKLFILNEYGDALKTLQLTPSIRGIAISKKYQTHNIAYISHGDIVSMIDIDSGQTLDCVKETDASGESGTFLPLGIDTDNVHGNVYVCDYRNSCVIKFDDKLEFITQWRIYNHSDQYDEARPKLISAYGQRLYIIIEHSCKPYFNQGIAYTFSLHICDANSGNIIKIIDAELLSTERLRWPCSVQAINNDKCYILDTMTSGKYFNGQWQKHWSRVLEIGQNNTNIMTELFQLDSEAAAMTMTKQIMIIAANGEILFVDLGFLQQQHKRNYEKHYQNLS